MTFTLTYDLDYQRTIPAVIIDSRAVIPAIKNQLGYVVKKYFDAQVALVGANSLPYKIETNDGNLAGICTIEVSGNTAILGQFVLRPAFQQFILQIQQVIGTFIQNFNWQDDFLQ